MRILLLEDHLALAKLVREHLLQFGAIDLAHDLVGAKYLLDSKDYDLLILDLVLPDGNSLELCSFLQENKIQVPILFLTAEVDVQQKLRCLQNGDDYLSKPFNISELEARVRNLLLKRKGAQALTLQFADLSLNSTTHQAHLGEQELKLNRKEFLLLELFMSQPKKIFSRAALAEKIWQEDEVLFGNSIETTITNLRRKLSKKFIKTIKGVGYTLEK